MDLKEFGVFFSKARERSGYKSQRELADRSGVSHSTINRIESGAHRATPETLKQLAPFLKEITYDELLEKLQYRDEDTFPNEDLARLPEVQFIMRAKNDLSPKAFEKFMELAKKTKEMFEDEDDD